MLRKQSECNESDYIRKQNQRMIDLEIEAQRLRQTIVDRDNEIHKLKREIHKLRVSNKANKEDITFRIIFSN